MRLIRSFGYAYEGLQHCYRKEMNFRIHVSCAILAIIAGVSLAISLTNWIIIIGCIGMVLALEMINTAIERLCDIVSLERKPQIKAVKDISAGAVLVGAFISVCIGLIVFLPKLLTLLKLIK
jgi:diacylglycerol kinase